MAGFGWQMFVKMAIPMIENAGETYIGKDENSTGRDDLIGQSLIYVAKLLNAIISDKATLPKAPEALR
jgi:hypothetical protein